MIRHPDSGVITPTTQHDAVPEAPAHRLKVLVVDDDRTLAAACAGMLGSDRCDVTLVNHGDEAMQLVARGTFDLVLLDLYMTPVPGIEILKAAVAARPDVLVVIMTGQPSVESNIETLRAGAWEYLPKPFAPTHLRLVYDRAELLVAERRSEQQRHHTPPRTSGEQLPLIGVSRAFTDAVSLARSVAATNASVVLLGESGTGKELVARFIHAQSRRASQRLVSVNCAALPEPLLESEMFGHRRGAFTGADSDKVGLLAAANGGTLFLDEFTEMSHAIQTKLLRVLQDGVVRRLGDDVEETVDVRIVAATNRDAEQAVRDGLLRGDLFYRLWVFPIRLPALRERPEDIEQLAIYFLGQLWHRHRGAAAALPWFDGEALAALQSRRWPGNVRELQNTIERIVVVQTPGTAIRLADLPPDDLAASHAPDAHASVYELPYHAAKERVLADFEKVYLEQLVARARGNMSRAARLAGVDRTTLYRLLEKHASGRGDTTP